MSYGDTTSAVLDWLGRQTAPRDLPAICAGTGMPRDKVRTCIATLVFTGRLVKFGTALRYRYGLAGVTLELAPERPQHAITRRLRRPDLPAINPGPLVPSLGVRAVLFLDESEAA